MGQEGKVYLPVVPRMSPESFGTLAAAMAGLVLITATCTVCVRAGTALFSFLFSPNGKGGGCGERGSDINSYQGD